jgi:hypothetical protein
LNHRDGRKHGTAGVHAWRCPLLAHLLFEEGKPAMDQKYDVAPQAEIRLDGRRVTRSDVQHDWGLRLQWEVRKDGKVIATPAARIETNYEHPDATPGKYDIVLQMWKYVDYKKTPAGEFVNSKFVDISNKVSYTIEPPAPQSPTN